MTIFYQIWVDAINFEIKKNQNLKSWKIFTFSYMTVFLSWNIAALYSFILLVTNFDLGEKIKENVSFLPTNMLNNILWAVVALFIPSILINYFLIFYKKRYETFLERYEYKNGKFLALYFAISLFFLIGFSLLNKFLK